MPEGVLLVGPHGRVEFANRRARELTGHSPQALEGLPLESLLPGGLDGDESDEPRRLPLRRADGTDVPVEVRVGWVGAPKRSRVVLLREADDSRPEVPRTTDATFRAVVEQISAITYTWSWRDGEYFVVYSSPQIERILGYTPQEWIADPTAWYEWVHAEDRAAVIEENKRCEETAEPYSMQYRMLRKDGRVIWVEDSWVVVENEDDGRRVFQGVVFDVTERKLAEQEIAFLVHHDKLTGLPNRALFEETLEQAISRARRHRLGVSVLYLDLDNFKLVNDSLGHHAGDQLLMQLADRLRECVRETDHVARQSGDEFLMLLSDLDRAATPSLENETSAIASETVARRVEAALREPFVLGDAAIRVSGSIGISLFPQDGEDSETLLRNADAAMYQAKKHALGGYVLYSGTGARPLDKLGLTARLRRAVELEQWLLHYQPIIDLSDGRMTGVEALIRWQEPDGTLVAPGEFIPLAEELGLIEVIGDWVIREMAYQQRAWADAGLDLAMSINLWPRQLWSNDLADRLLGTLKDARVHPGRIIVEVTESTAMSEPGRTQRVLTELHDAGLVLAIDDFGTGSCSLSRLKDLPVDILKVDRSFIHGADRDPTLGGMVRAMIELAQAMGMTPHAEGVETAGEHAFLRTAWCRMAQGFYFARPAPADAIPALVSPGRMNVQMRPIGTNPSLA
jgi:diguanylate cyclase (GGDEF)-like protein/PAS domain S-box-containing protein